MEHVSLRVTFVLPAKAMTRREASQFVRSAIARAIWSNASCEIKESTLRVVPIPTLGRKGKPDKDK